MFSKWKVVCTVLAVGVLSFSASADITVGFAPVDSTITDIGLTTNVNIVADIPESDKILGWGIDLTVFNPAITSWTLVSIGGSFTPVTSQDGDNLAGLVSPQGFGLWGNGIVLATLQFTGLSVGTTGILASDGNPPDLGEGFALDPTGFANVIYNAGSVTVTPEPTALSLLALAGLAVLRRR